MTAPRRRPLLLALAALLPLSAGAAEPAPPEPAGYRQTEYRAATPETLAGAQVLTTAQARALWQGGRAAFIDVLPQAPRPAGLPAGTIWRDKQRFDIPGSVWLPDTGYGALAPPMQDYFVRNLHALRAAHAGPPAGVLLPGRLLDVVERRQARAGLGLCARRLVSGRHHRLAGSRAHARAAPSSATPLTASETPRTSGCAADI